VPALYVDTSALGRVLLGEPDRAAILRELTRFDQKVSSRLLGVELRRLALPSAQLDATEQLLAGIALIPIADPILRAAETIRPAMVATLDAIHLATAVALAEAGTLDAVMTYDAQLAQGAQHHGITVIAPS
jgi:uncharacterized protein